MALRHAPPPSLGFKPMVRTINHCNFLFAAAAPTGLGLNFRLPNVRNRSVFALATSYQESKPSDIDTENEKVGTVSSSTDESIDISKARDFCVGIPYGAILSIGGFISFMLTGSIPAIRFGVVLGGALLALSLSSLRSWKNGESWSLSLKGQTAIASILCVRDMRILSQGPSIARLLTTLISSGVFAFYIYRIASERGQSRKSNSKVEAQY